MAPDLNGDDLQRLHHLAELNGVSTSFWDWAGNHRQIMPGTLLRVLRALEVPVTVDAGAEEIEAAIQWTDDQPWLQTLPDCTVTRMGEEREVPVHLPHGRNVYLWCILEDGRQFQLQQLDRWVPPREIDGELIGRATFHLPGDLPLGYHRFRTEIVGEDQVDEAEAPLYVVPQRLDPPALSGGQRYWGVNVQAYSVRSGKSWGVGDAEDLADLTAICAEEGADFLLINPLHASEPVPPIEESPYLPISRRWLNAGYIRPEAVPEFVELGPRLNLLVEKERLLAASAPATRGGAINRDQAWQSKRKVLEIVFKQPRSIHREAQYQKFLSRGGEDLYNYALWCALAEHFGTTDLPAEYQDPNCRAVQELAPELHERIEFHRWCQWIAKAQCQEPQRVSEDLGMKIGIMSDMAVGVNALSAEYWAHRDQFAKGITVGAPPDMYAQQGQDWSQPPWNPRALERSGFTELRDVVRAAMDLAGAVRIDHILGFFRLWWIPEGASAEQGTYVSFNHEAMIGVLLLEAHRQGTLVIGEDLGTVEPWVRQYLAERGILGTSVLWFEKDHSGWPLHADHYRREVLATVNTHDLPPTAGYMDGVHTTLREDLGLLVDPVHELRGADEEEQRRMRARLAEWGLLEEGADDDEMIEALHKYICRTPARLVALALVDAVGEMQPQNLPGTNHEYPNWRIPLSDSNGDFVWLEELADRADFKRFTSIMRSELEG